MPGVITHLRFNLLLQMLISCFSCCFFFPTKNIWALCLLHTHMGKKKSLIYEANGANFPHAGMQEEEGISVLKCYHVGHHNIS